MVKKILMEAKWFDLLEEEFKKPYMVGLQELLAKEVEAGIEIFPSYDLIFDAFCKTSFDDVKVVLVGQDPYHGVDQAHGLAFSVQENAPLPPSLKNIYKELKSDLGIDINKGCLSSWAEQGVLLLNATLTVREGLPMSHHGKGWETFTDKVVEELAKGKKNLVFLLWGRLAQEKCFNVLNKYKSNSHLVLSAAHPSPFSANRGFLGCRHFSKANEFLNKIYNKSIDWKIA